MIKQWFVASSQLVKIDPKTGMGFNIQKIGYVYIRQTNKEIVLGGRRRGSYPWLLVTTTTTKTTQTTTTITSVLQ